MKNNEKKVKATEEVKEEIKPEENGVELTEEELSQVNAGLDMNPPKKLA